MLLSTSNFPLSLPILLYFHLSADLPFSNPRKTSISSQAKKMKKVAGLVLAGFLISPWAYSNISLYYSSDCKILQHLSNTHDLSSSFISTPWLNLGVLQSYYGSTPSHMSSDIHQIEKIVYNREILQFEDGGSYSLDWSGKPSQKVLFIVPGLTGGSEAPYIKHIVQEGISRGFLCVIINGRGINGTPLTVIHI